MSTVLTTLSPDKAPLEDLRWDVDSTPYVAHDRAIKVMRQMHKVFRRNNKLIRRLRAKIEKLKE